MTATRTKKQLSDVPDVLAGESEILAQIAACEASDREASAAIRRCEERAKQLDGDRRAEYGALAAGRSTGAGVDAIERKLAPLVRERARADALKAACAREREHLNRRLAAYRKKHLTELLAALGPLLAQYEAESAAIDEALAICEGTYRKLAQAYSRLVPAFIERLENEEKAEGWGWPASRYQRAVRMPEFAFLRHSTSLRPTALREGFDFRTLDDQEVTPKRQFTAPDGTPMGFGGNPNWVAENAD